MKLGRHIDFKFCPMCASVLVEGPIDGAMRRYCEKCGWIHYLNPVVVVCIIAHCGEKVVLIKRGIEPEKGEWSLPGGFVDVLEEPCKAATRELEEEAGVLGENFPIIDAVHQDSPRYTSVIVIGYEVAFDKEEPLVAGDDAVDAKWVDISEVQSLPFDSFNKIFGKWKKLRIVNNK